MESGVSLPCQKGSSLAPIQCKMNPLHNLPAFQFDNLLRAKIFQAVSFLQVYPLKFRMIIFAPKIMTHALPIQSFLLLITLIILNDYFKS
jgi:hypothetical protein